MNSAHFPGKVGAFKRSSPLIHRVLTLDVLSYMEQTRQVARIEVSVKCLCCVVPLKIQWSQSVGRLWPAFWSNTVPNGKIMILQPVHVILQDFCLFECLEMCQCHASFKKLKLLVGTPKMCKNGTWDLGMVVSVWNIRSFMKGRTSWRYI